MTLRHTGRLLAWVAVAILVPLGDATVFGQIGFVGGVGVMVFAALAVWLWLPRAAHAAFEAGAHKRAGRWYRALAMLAVTARRERESRLSRAACAVLAGPAAGDDADRWLRGLDPATFDMAERTVWLNNRAYAQLTAGTGDAHAALALANEAAELRPDVPAVQHTRGLALLAIGRVDDAIAVLDAMRAAGELPPRLEAARCRDLARAWTQKGELAYADDYTSRAALLEPTPATW